MPAPFSLEEEANVEKLPHLGSSPFPGVPTSTKPSNDFNYKRYDGRATVKICRVPWDADGSNVPGFETDAARDAYLDALSGEIVKVDAKSAFRTLPDGTLKIPVPFSNAACYNYVVIDYEQVPGSGMPLDYAQGESINRWLYFISDISSDAPSTTTLALTVDWWCVYANLVKVQYMMLERGHAPMSAAADVDAFLENPVGNSRYLTSPDIDYGSAAVAKGTHTCSFNSNVYFCLCSYADFSGSSGTRETSGWNCPQGAMQNVGNAPGGYVYAVEPSDALALLSTLETSQPELLASVRSAFFIGRAFVDVKSTFQFSGITVHTLGASVKTIALADLSAVDFGIPEECAAITKLYTSPYSVIEVLDSTGNTSTVRVQDCAGVMNVRAKTSLTLPFIGVDSVVTGIGGLNANVEFDQIANADYLIGGSGNTMRRLGIPTFAVKIDSADSYSYSTYYDRVQAQHAADNANASSLASNATAYQNAVDSANTALANATDSANTGESNTNRSNAAAQAITSENNEAALNIRTYAADMADNTTDRANSAIDTFVSVDNGVNAGSTAIGEDVAAVGGVLNAGQAIMSGIAGGDPLGGAAQAIDTGVGTFISITKNGALSTLTQQANSLKGAEKKLVNSYNNAQAQAAALATTNRQNTARTNNTNTQVNASNANAADSADTAIGNATRSNGTAIGNAQRSKGTADANAARALDTAESAIQNGVNQAALMPPDEVCAATGENGSTRPTYVGVRVVTENDADLYAAGAQMARYGYSYGGYWDFTTYNVMPHFSYWRASEVMLSAEGRTVMHDAEDAIKSMLVTGVTVWRNPDEIGTLGVFDNVQ